MNKTLRYILITLIAVVSASVYGADFTTVSDLPVVQLLGDDYYVYTTKKNESLFGVSRKFGWDDEILFKLNPTAVSPLKKGMKLYYPVNPGKNTASQEAAANRTIIPSDVTHIVKRGRLSTAYQAYIMFRLTVYTNLTRIPRMAFQPVRLFCSVRHRQQPIIPMRARQYSIPSSMVTHCRSSHAITMCLLLRF